MHSDPTIVASPESVLALAFFGLLILVALALFIYSIVAKKYWLTILMLTLPIRTRGSRRVIAFFSFSLVQASTSRSDFAIEAEQLYMHEQSSREAEISARLTAQAKSEKVDDISIPDIAWSTMLCPPLRTSTRALLRADALWHFRSRKQFDEKLDTSKNSQ